MAFTKGQSGNPAGRPKGSSHVQRCRKFAEKKGWTILEGLAQSDDKKIQVDALKLIFAYGFGKPIESHEINGKVSWEQFIEGSHL